jgi:hypothetical protein
VKCWVESRVRCLQYVSGLAKGGMGCAFRGLSRCSRHAKSGNRGKSQPFSLTSINHLPIFEPQHYHKMAGPPNKKQKRQEYKEKREDGTNTELPKKKFYRQRAHANPFSDHNLT